jgi:uncharacterized protein (DUF1684 family)
VDRRHAGWRNCWRCIGPASFGPELEVAIDNDQFVARSTDVAGRSGLVRSSRLGCRVPTYWPRLVACGTWVVKAYYTPYLGPERVEVATARDDLRQHVTTVGTVHLALGGSAYELVATAARHRRREEAGVCLKQTVFGRGWVSG